MPLECLLTESRLTDAVAGRASAAEQLRLEAHLESCAACRAKHAEFEALRSLKRWDPAGLADGARERVRRALHASREEPAPRWRPGRTLWVAATAAVGVALAVLWAAPWRPDHGPVVTPPGVAGPPAATAPDPLPVQPGPDGTARLGDATVEVAPGTVALWHAAARTVELRRGAVTVDLPAGRGHGFRVQTPAFGVVVTGTRFRVDLVSVVTERGRVNVLGTDDRVLAEVPAGDRWDLRAANASAAAATAPATAPAACGPQSPAAAAGAQPPAERLAAARRALAAGRVAAARALLRPLLRERPGVAAEAHSLMADSYLVARDYGAAIRGYRAVVRGYGGTPQAETALYAIGQLEAERGDRDAAAAALARYLSRYPSGRFAAEARTRLQRLTAGR